MIKVDANSLDYELEKIDSVDFLKIDIEGGEYNAFLGLLNSIEQKKIKRIIFEWNKLMQGDESKKFSKLLSEILFKFNGFIYGLDEHGNPIPTTLEFITSHEFYPYALIEFS